MHNWLEQIEIVQSPTDLDRIEKEINEAIRMAEQDILRLNAEMEPLRRTYEMLCEKRGHLYQEIRTRKELIEKIADRRDYFEELRRKEELERWEQEKKLMSREAWRDRAKELTKNGFPESDEQIYQLFEAYCYMDASKEEIEDAMLALERRGLGPIWIKKSGDGLFRGQAGQWVPDGFDESGYKRDDLLYQKNGIKFWMDDCHYYLKIDFTCGCSSYYSSYGCTELSIRLGEQSDVVTIIDYENDETWEYDEIIAVKRAVCPYDKSFLLDFSVELECGHMCETPLLSMIFAPFYLEKYYGRGAVLFHEFREYLKRMIEHGLEGRNYFSDGAASNVVMAEADDDKITMQFERQGKYFNVFADQKMLSMRMAQTACNETNGTAMSEFYDLDQLMDCICKFIDDHM